jgi:low molecular weight protein-tyrosine phosphatase
MRPYLVCFVCTGNICRSPMAGVVFRALVDRAGLGGAIEVDSAGTGDWHVGNGADARAVRALADAGYGRRAHRARQFEPGWFAERDLVVALDAGHLRALRRLRDAAGASTEIRLLRSFDPAAGNDLDVPDPYYGDRSGFTLALQQVERACEGLLAHVEDELTARPS